VIGGGLAGLAAALELVDAGHSVTVLEARPTLGGAVQTLPAREGDPDPPPDNGQHIALGCFRDYLAFLARIGRSADVRRGPLRLPVIDERGRRSTIANGAASLLRYRHIPLRERIAVARALARMRAVDPASVDGTFGAYLRGLGQSPTAIERFWDVFVRPALNLRADEASAEMGLVTVRDALLGPKGSSDLVLPTAPLGELHGDAAGEALGRSGATVRTNARVAALGENAAVLADGESVEADAFVLAVPPAESARLLDEPEPRLADSPIVSVHLLFDRVLLRAPLAALLHSDAHWVFDRGALTGCPPERGQYLTVVSSGAPDLLEVRGRELPALMAREVTARLGHAELLWSRVSREPAATFAATPESGSQRRGVRTKRPNVARAGAWTDTGWPATMEGAVRSGRTAAALLAGDATARVLIESRRAAG
jgi:squalene-associated FAD-dependent desaturase